MTVVTGLIDAGDVLANELPVDMSDLVHKRQNETAEFRTMLEKIGSKPAVAKKVEWLEEDLIPRVSALAASATSAATAITVTTGEGDTVFAPNDVIRIVETDEGMLVNSVSANSVGVTRSWGGVAAASASSASKILIVGNVSAAGASSGTARYQKRVAGFNFLSDQRNVFSFTDLTTGIKHYGNPGSEPEAEMVRKMDEHSRACETTLFYGARDVDLSASPGERGSCGGALEFISTNILDAGGALSPSEFETFLEDPYGVSGRGNKVLFAAPRVATVLSQAYRDKWVPATTGSNQVFGAKVTAFIHATYGMEIPVVVKREWHDLDKTGTGYGTNAFLLDLDHIRLRILDGRYNILRKNLQEPSSTQVTLEYRSIGLRPEQSGCVNRAICWKPRGSRATSLTAVKMRRVRTISREAFVAPQRLHALPPSWRGEDTVRPPWRRGEPGGNDLARPIRVSNKSAVFSLEFGVEEAHGLIRGVTSYSAS